MIMKCCASNVVIILFTYLPQYLLGKEKIPVGELAWCPAVLAV